MFTKVWAEEKTKNKHDDLSRFKGSCVSGFSKNFKHLKKEVQKDSLLSNISASSVSFNFGFLFSVSIELNFFIVTKQFIRKNN